MDQTTERTLTNKQRKTINALIYDLDYISTKQLLYAIACHFTIAPALNVLTFIDLLDRVTAHEKRLHAL